VYKNSNVPVPEPTLLNVAYLTIPGPTFNLKRGAPVTITLSSKSTKIVIFSPIP